MHLSDLTTLLGVPNGPAPDRSITSVTEDSRRAVPGALFVAAPGVRSDGHDHAAEAAAKGAVAILGEHAGLAELNGLPYFHVSNARKALGIVAHALAGNPTCGMTVIGVTGTNGKTSSVFLIKSILSACGLPAGSFGTLGYTFGDTTVAADHTTPFGEDLAALFRRASDAGVRHVAMEASSHAIAQERIAGIEFMAALFTNLTQDHLDYHATMDAYCEAKLGLFRRIEGAGRFTVVNADDPHAPRFVEASRVPCHTFGRQGDCRATKIRADLKRTSFHLTSPWGTAEIETSLLGAHNVMNVLGAITVCAALGQPLEAIARGVAALKAVPGRFEHVESAHPFQVVVDYAHTEDGLRNVLNAARAICKERVIVVFGCGGDRDKTKRPKMAAAAAQLADYSIITSDNPRTEDPERILLDIESGIQHAGKRKTDDYLVFLDRAEAIQRGIDMARPGDLVLIAGKGHEDYQIVGTTRVRFDDREVARTILGAG